MKRLTALIIMAALAVQAQVTIPRLNRKVETSAPQDIQLQLRRGETLDLSIQFTSYATVMDLIGATVTLHAVTNGMPSGTSYQVVGTATSNGTATVRIVTDDWVPGTLSTGTWTMEVSQPSLSRIMRASGDLRVTGLVYPSAVSPLPTDWATNLWNAISGIRSRTNDWDTAFGWGDHALAGYLTTESDPGIPAAITTAVAQAGTNAQGYANAALSNAVLFASTNRLTRIFNPSNSSEFIDGAGNKYVISNFWNMTFAPDFAEGYSPAQTNYLFTSLSQSYYEGGSFGKYWLLTPNRVEFKPSNLSTLWLWEATTNEFVLQQSLFAGESYIFIQHWTTTNLVATLATESSLIEGLAGKVGTDRTITVNGVSGTLTSNLTFTVETGGGNVTSVFGRTGVVVAVTGDYTASQVGALTAQETTNAIASASSANFIVRLTTQKITTFTFTPTNATYYGDCSGGLLETNAVITVLAGNTGAYPLAWLCTNTVFTTLQGSYVNVDLYGYENESGDQQYRLEAYRVDLATGAASEWGDGGHTFTIPISMGKITEQVYVPSVSTNAFLMMIRLKRMGGTATNLRNLYIGTGSGTLTFFSMTVPASVPIDAHNATSSAHDNMIRTHLLWSALGTNATYRMSWDTTNGTFKVEEILP